MIALAYCVIIVVVYLIIAEVIDCIKRYIPKTSKNIYNTLRARALNHTKSHRLSKRHINALISGKSVKLSRKQMTALKESGVLFREINSKNHHFEVVLVS